MSPAGALSGALGLSVALAWLLAGALGVARAPAGRAGPGARADLAIAAVGAVVLVGLGVLVGALAAPGLGLVGLGIDHCADHGGHAHLCLRHGPPGPGLVGGLGLALLAARLPALVGALAELLRLERTGRRLAALGAGAGGLRVVPTAAPLCHTVGLLRPVSLVSGPLLQGLPPGPAAALIAHEAAHRAAHDTRAAAALGLSAALIPPLRPWLALWRVAAEELADEAAAAATDRLTAAEALIRVAGAGPAPALGLGAVGGGVEARVQRLLQPGPAPSPRRAPAALLGMGLALAAALALGHHELHHAAETIWAWGQPGGW